MMFQMRIPSLGCVSFDIDDMSHARHAIILQVKDESGIAHRVECNRIQFPDDRFDNYGWAQIIGYTMLDKFVEYNKFVTLF